MLRIARAPPVVGLALAAGAGATLLHLGVHPSWTFLSLPLLLRPESASNRPPSPRLPLILAFLAGAFLTHSWAGREAGDCRYRLEEGAALEFRGRLQGRLAEERGEISPLGGSVGGCNRPLRFVLGGGASGEARENRPPPPPGSRLLLRGRWRRSGAASARDPLRAGYLKVDSLDLLPPDRGGWRDPGGMAGRVQVRLGALFPDERGMVEALVLARKEGLSPAVKESFSRAGTAHLLAISGFHVGVVAGLLLLAGGWMGLAFPTRFLLGSAGVWGYVLFIGLPDAALRAALILTLLSLGRLRNRAVAPLGALASAFLLFLFGDPGALLRPGFQLSFAGALGLVVWGPPMARRLSEGNGFRVPPPLAGGLAAGVSATLATLPLVAWHFGRVSLVGIPVTLLAAPMVTLAIPGILLSLLASLASPSLGAFLARGVELDLRLLARMVEWAATLPWASVWVSRPGLVAGVAGVLAASLVLEARPRARQGGGRTLLALGALSGLILWPVGDRVVGRGTVELVVLDVGQGDALLLRSPRGRWILVDAGPKNESFDAGARVVLPYLRRRGIAALDLMVLTHPDMDHVGGAEAVLREYPVAGVLDPGVPVGTGVFLGALEGARERGVPWRVAEAGDSLDLDGLALRVLWPPGAGALKDPATLRQMEALEAGEGANARSIVLELRYGDFSALLTGDAPAPVEEEVLSRILSPGIRVLKVGHHGSRTSTSPELLERISPELALVSVGGRNRYGHPHAEVLHRLQAGGAGVGRTDRSGTLTLRARRDGTFAVRGERGIGVIKSVSVASRMR